MLVFEWKFKTKKNAENRKEYLGTIAMTHEQSSGLASSLCYLKLFLNIWLE